MPKTYSSLISTLPVAGAGVVELLQGVDPILRKVSGKLDRVAEIRSAGPKANERFSPGR